MNERIQELFVRAYGYIPLPIEDHISPEMERFAELLVRECINVIAESREVRQTAYYYRNRLAEHFGVE